MLILTDGYGQLTRQASPKMEKSEKKAETGATMIEYALMGALIAVVCVVAVTFIGRQASQSFSTIASGFDPQ